jgi:hypothetical protein
MDRGAAEIAGRFNRAVRAVRALCLKVLVPNKPFSITATFSTRYGTLSWRRTGSRISGDNRKAYAMAFVYKRRTALDFRLKMLDFVVDADTYERVLRELGGGIRRSADWAESAAEEQLDDEIEFVEGLLGAAYVVCQTQINAVVQATLRVPDRAITFPNGDAPDVRALDPQFNGKYSKIELLWALANYYKHKDQWTRSTWDNPPAQQKRTILVLTAAGLSFGSSLRTGAQARTPYQPSPSPTFPTGRKKRAISTQT